MADTVRHKENQGSAPVKEGMDPPRRNWPAMAADHREKQWVDLLRAKLDSTLEIPLFRQLYEALRDAILTGELGPGFRLPSTRDLAATLELSRTTVVSSYDQLLAEGYVQSAVGSGTWVCHSLPGPEKRQPLTRGRILSRAGEAFAKARTAAVRAHYHARAFCPALPAVDAFPFQEWGRLQSRIWRKQGHQLVAYGEPAGYEPLRRQIAQYVSGTRQVRCSYEQVVVTSGSQQALNLSARVLVNPGENVWVEEPGYLGAKAALSGVGAHLVPVPVDAEGLSVSDGADRCPCPRLIYVSPSHQFPLGVTLSLSRRLGLLEWASGCGAWVLEDDYDSEFRYTSRPIASLQSLDRDDRVLYVGTFSKVLYPSLRLGYVVVPPDLVDVFLGARAAEDRHPPLLEQAAMAAFLEEGLFGRHLKRMKELYEERRDALLEALASGSLEPGPSEGGIHLVGWFRGPADDVALSQAAAREGIEANALSYYSLEPLRRTGLLLGFGGVPPSEIRRAAARLERVLTGAEPAIDAPSRPATRTRPSGRPGRRPRS